MTSLEVLSLEQGDSCSYLLGRGQMFWGWCCWQFPVRKATEESVIQPLGCCWRMETGCGHPVLPRAPYAWKACLGHTCLCSAHLCVVCVHEALTESKVQNYYILFCFFKKIYFSFISKTMTKTKIFHLLVYSPKRPQRLGLGGTLGLLCVCQEPKNTGHLSLLSKAL